MQLKEAFVLLANLNKWAPTLAFLWISIILLHLSIIADASNSLKIAIPDLPSKHYRYWLRNNKPAFNQYKTICKSVPNVSAISSVKELHRLYSNFSLENNQYLKDLDYEKSVLAEICNSIHLVNDSCWGYESGCQYIYVMPVCENSPNMHEIKKSWFNLSDFGYIIKLRRESNRICRILKDEKRSIKSSLECFGDFDACRGDFIMFDFKDLASKQPQLMSDGKKQDLIKSGQVGGWYCDFTKQKVQKSRKDSLISWYNELKHYEKLEGEPEKVCDERIGKQVFIIKLGLKDKDMYNYIRNFINLYATFHLINKFSQNNQIIIWDWEQLPQTKFELLWKAFSSNDLQYIGQFKGKKVCFEKYILTLTAEDEDGLYYNPNPITDCSKSGLFDAFNKHVLHKLSIKQNYTQHEHVETDNRKLRINFISRSSFEHRKILNEKQLIRNMKEKYPEHIIELVDYAGDDFYQHLETTSNTDLLIGLHGAELTHTLFLPDWAGLFEIYNCNDTRYGDLARLRGATYFTMDPSEAILKKRVEDLNATKLLDNENYEIIPYEFLKTLGKAIEKVKENRATYFVKDKSFQVEQSKFTEEGKKTSTRKARHTEL